MKKIVLNIVLLLNAIIFTSCDKDFNSIGSDVLGDDHFGLEKRDDFSVIAYSKGTGAVQSNNLSSNMLGVYHQDDFFGTTTASFVTQVALASVAPDLGIEREIQANDSVYLYIPYTSTQTASGEGIEPNTFELSSIYGDEDTAFDLKIYQNGYLLRDFDAVDPSTRQKYYSNENTSIESNVVGGQLNNSSNPLENAGFKFSKDEIIIYKTNGNGEYLNSENQVTTDLTKRVVKERLAPGMWINLDKTVFETEIINANASDLANNNVFKEHFRGLYFKVDAISGSNAMALLDFSKGYITVQYHSKAALTTDELKKKSLKINLSGNTVNFFQNNFSSAYGTALNDSNSTTGDELLYMKGNEGSVVFIDLFGPDNDANNVPDELDELRNGNLLINDAFLTFYAKKGEINGQTLDAKKYATRIYLYDATNNTPILDYTFDSSTATDPKNNKLIFGGILEVDDSDEAVKYRIRLNNHINRIVNGTNENTNKNVRLGLSVTENIANSSSYNVFNSTSFGNEKLPVGSIISPSGTVVYGNNTSVDDKKLKLEIYYTKPN
ncbi:conserved hypothetical protein [Flavobacterium sp. 9AF]|uniref:DUF4270 domain-containing protein n=1 Tax=Flavobacterium sp. 9AF TaxID=2653142 RepID=UPI0012EF9BC8|nr:DUF4270 domain-containing protein [Flavobacterium sp. 9AF]VXB34886.1 conserved hypothetical protein [Flavobacterium sp. 9AF]